MGINIESDSKASLNPPMASSLWLTCALTSRFTEYPVASTGRALLRLEGLA
jgi:hypothetical protein